MRKEPAELAGVSGSIQTDPTVEISLSAEFDRLTDRINRDKRQCSIRITEDICTVMLLRSGCTCFCGEISCDQDETEQNTLFGGEFAATEFLLWYETVTSKGKEFGLANLHEMQSSQDPEPGLSPDWAYIILKADGTYQQMAERNQGMNTPPLAFDGGFNALWNNGGLQYLPPFR